MNYKAYISRLVRELLKRTGLPQEKFAAKLGVTYPTINRWKKGDDQMKNITLNSKKFQICGIADDDPYFVSLNNNTFDDLASVFSKIIKPHYTCIDIGANIGCTSLLMSTFIVEGRILSIEASPTVYACLKDNVKNIKNIKTINCAVSDREEKIFFKENSAWGFISGNQEDTAVDAVTIDWLKSAENIQTIDFIKIDTEGWEPKIIRNATDLLKRDKTVVVMEFNSWCMLAYSRENPRDFIEYLTSNFRYVYLINKKDFSFERILPGKELEALHTNLVYHGCCSDIVFTDDAEKLAL